MLITPIVIPAHLYEYGAESKGRGGLLYLPALFPAVFRAPVIRGAITVNEGDTLNLDCDASNSRPSPSVAWLNPEGEMVSFSRALIIENIPRDATGTYSCVATLSGATMTSSESVTVQCECVSQTPTQKEEMFFVRFLSCCSVIMPENACSNQIAAEIVIMGFLRFSYKYSQLVCLLHK